MSGGHWDYLGAKLEQRSDGDVWRLLAAIEHELDWGLSGDTCLDCARLRVSPALEAYFDAGCEDASAAIAIVRDRKQHQCARHAELPPYFTTPPDGTLLPDGEGRFVAYKAEGE